MELIRFAIRRVIGAAPVAFAVLVVTFLMLRLVPGDPVQVIAGTTLDPDVAAELREQLGLDDPLWHQFWDYLTGVFRGDLGTSYLTDRPVSTIIGDRILNTLRLSCAGLLIAVCISVPFGVWVGRRRKGDAGVGFTTATTMMAATPDFLLATILSVVFAVQLGWFPVAGDKGWTSLVLPAVALGIPLAGIQARVVRAGIADASQQPFVRTLRAVGVAERTILTNHVAPNASIPLITLLSVEFSRVIAGALVVENIFAWPGLGTTIFESIERRDLPAVQGEILVVALVILLVNIVVDVLYRVIDPRIGAT
ncbi:ABC transporter permease [Desertimonas flava]|uniref:ABC transporter permease n=1 Tax=Desertimonas flava TaxID=2064846 RepID=UPI000E35504B|nr:ABC transporter permease [Desertimonas flava]